ncbi:large ribosomal subunit protein uL29m [Phymastichus coffea]|uniref:large ribosomal subunit protein uL29m n=1 Tax=Phymastichus coffea TaxID=108790 RepID=UPI00273CDF6A|nr:large ribosomal subunit protein uL29m [Phymastichus coffea]
MATLIKVLKAPNTINSMTKLLSNLSLNKILHPSASWSFQTIPTVHRCASLHTTLINYGLEEFFDVEKNWSKSKIQTGRSWKKDELRIKSNEDLHKLWYVLLKERNMLMTMEHAYNEAYELFPSPERIDKVLDSMDNLEAVVRERNEAYYQLETGESGERPSKIVNNVLGIRHLYKLRQYTIPKFINSIWKKKHQHHYNGYAVRKFLRLYREKLWNEKRKEINRQTNNVVAILKKFPNTNLDAIRAKYPKIDLEKALRSNKLKSLGNASRRA